MFTVCTLIALRGITRPCFHRFPLLENLSWTDEVLLVQWRAEALRKDICLRGLVMIRASTSNSEYHYREVDRGYPKLDVT